VKNLSPKLDWISRATGDYVARVLTCWRTGLLDELPECLDHTTEAVAYDLATNTTTLLMRDVAETLVPEGDDVVPFEQHRRFIEHMAELHATFWDVAATLPELTPMCARYTALTPLTAAIEASLGTPSPVMHAIDTGWRALDARAGDVARIARALIDDPWPLVTAFENTPTTLVHGDWKMGNLGSHPDGRTVLLDWQWPGAAPPCVDVMWYVAINASRLPEPKDDVIAAYREALERRGIETGSWFERQLALATLGAFVQLGWNKVDEADELAWWAPRALAARTLL
jgi:thiamine kinase-like enzyme